MKQRQDKPTSTKGIGEKLDKILQTTQETPDLMKSKDKKESEVSGNGRLESII